MESMAPTVCDYCKVRQGSMRCSHCSHDYELEEGIKSTFWYCTLECRLAAAHDHQKECRERRERMKLYRARFLAQRIFIMTRERLFSWTLNDVMREGKRLICSVTLPLSENGVLQPFPRNLPIIISDHERLAILSYLEQPGALADMVGFMEMLLPGFSVNEAFVSISAYDTLTTFQGESAFSYEASPMHSFWFAPTPDGSTYIVDLTGAQFGLQEPVMPMKRYWKTINFAAFATHDMGYYKSHIVPGLARSMLFRFPHLFYKMQTSRMLMESLCKRAVLWEQENGTRLSDVLQLPDTEFDARSEEILACLKQHMPEALVKIDTFGLLQAGTKPDASTRDQGQVSGGSSKRKRDPEEDEGDGGRAKELAGESTGQLETENVCKMTGVGAFSHWGATQP